MLGAGDTDGASDGVLVGSDFGTTEGLIVGPAALGLPLGVSSSLAISLVGAADGLGMPARGGRTAEVMVGLAVVGGNVVGVCDGSFDGRAVG